MEDYKVLQTGDEIQEILNQAPVDTADIAELKEAATSLDGRLEAVEGKIPSGASSENPLTDKQYVDSSIASASATFRGTYNEVTDLELTTDATHADIGSALDEVIELADSNDYCFVQIPTDDETPTEIESIERYKFVTGTGWEYEYTLNNSGFTADQWSAINSGITRGLVTKLADLPTNAELETLLNGKANATDVYTKSETYNKTELDAQLGAKANSADVYPKTDTYTKQEVNALITTPEVQYVTVTATAGTTAVTDVLPATGAANTIYRVGSWDGTQYDDGVYSEYSWNGSAYILLDVKNYGFATGSDFDNPTTAQRELVTTVGSVLDGISEGVFDLTAKTGDSYATLADALTAANTSIPTNKKKGGMSIKFVQSSDNKYHQCRLMADTFTTDTAQWQGVDEVPTAGSSNLVESGGVKSEIDGKADVEDVFTLGSEFVTIPFGDSFVGIMRNTNLKVESSNNRYIYYFAVTAGRTYKVKGTNVTCGSAAWSMLGFSTTVPSDGSSYVDILSYETTGSKTYEETYTPSDDGYLLVYYQDALSVIAQRLNVAVLTTTKSSKIGDLTQLDTTAKSDLVGAINEVKSDVDSLIVDTLESSDASKALSANQGRLLKGDVDALSDSMTVERGVEITSVTRVTGMIMRASTNGSPVLKFETTATANCDIYYFPVVAGKKYNISAYGVTIGATTWSYVGFSTEAPVSNGTYIEVVAPSTTSSSNYDTIYTPNENGYICIYYKATESQPFYPKNRILEIVGEDKVSVERARAQEAEESLLGDIQNIDNDVYDKKILEVPKVVTDRDVDTVKPSANGPYVVMSHDNNVRTVYVSVNAGIAYNIKTSAEISVGADTVIAFFTEKKPAHGVALTAILTHDSSTANLDVNYTPQKNGYLCVCYYGNDVIRDRIVFYQKEEYISKIEEVYEATTYEAVVSSRVSLSSYVSGLIMRNTTAKFESTSSSNCNVIYYPVVAGRKYVLRGTLKNSAASWSLVGFSTAIPSANGVYTDVLSYETSGTFTIDDYKYTASADGYLCIFFEYTISTIDSIISLYELVTEREFVAPAILKGLLYEALNAKDALVDAPLSFNVGLTNLRAKTEEPTNLVINASGSNYNECIEQYINVQDGRSVSKLIQTGIHNLDPEIGDFSTLNSTYWREVIGVDSEGWIYCAQRKYSNLSQGTDVNIYKTKDFETFTVFKSNSCGHQLIELENGELCFATYETEEDGGSYYIKCNIYVTSQHKTVFNKKFSCTQISQYQPAAPWSWGIQSRGSVVAIGEYGKHGQCGKVWYSRDYGEHFYEVFDLRDNAPDVPHAHVHGICVDPYFDRIYIINGDGSPSTTPELAYKNPRLWYWDYNGETLSDDLKNTIDWKYVACGEDVSMGSNLQFVNGYALKDCLVFFSDGANNGIFRINRTTKEDIPVMDFAYHLGIDTSNTKWCGGNMFRRDDNSPLLICGIREYSQDLEPTDPNNPSHKPNTYKDVLSRVYATYDGYKFFEVWIDDTYGEYTVHYINNTSEQRNLAKCGRDMSVWQMYDGKVLLKYLGRDFQYVSYNDSGVTRQQTGYVDFANYVGEFIIK